MFNLLGMLGSVEPHNEIQSSSSDVVEDDEYISGVLEDKGSYGLFCAPKSPNQIKVIRRTIHWLDFAGIMGNSKIIIGFKEKTTAAGKCKSSRGTSESFEFIYSSIFTEDDIDYMLSTTCPHEVSHAVVHVDFPNGGVEPHGQEWKQSMWRMLGKSPSVTHSLDVIKQVRSRGGGYAFCGCDQGRGKSPVSPTVLKRLRSGETLLCSHCGSVMYPEAEVANSVALWKEDGMKERVKHAIRDAQQEMAEEDIVREEMQTRIDESAIEDMVLFCDCSDSRNSVLLSELPEKGTLVCEKCSVVFRPVEGVLIIRDSEEKKMMTGPF